MAEILKETEDSHEIVTSKAIKTVDNSSPDTKTREYEILCSSVFIMLYIHTAAVYGLYLCFTSAAWKTMILNVVLGVMAILGTTAGTHRLWSHNSYKARMPLQILFMLFTCVAAQKSVENWVRSHRMHHKYSETNADPHNVKRGFFFAHIGWLLVRHHKDYRDKMHTIDMSDIHSNPVLMFQKKYTFLLLTSLSFVLPTLIPMYFWGETFVNAWHLVILRYCYNLNVAFCINSYGHSKGYRPYDRRIAPSQHLILNLLTLGEGNHNFHHVFPNDYRSDEIQNSHHSLATLMIEFFEKIGWAYDLKSIKPEMIQSRAKKTGDGSVYATDY